MPSLLLIAVLLLLLGTLTSPSLAFQPSSTSFLLFSPRQLSLQHSGLLLTNKKYNTILLRMGAGSSSSSSSNALSEDAKLQFQHKSILLTGASRGLGRSLAHQLAECNVSLLILSGRDEDALQQVKKECEDIASSSSQQAALKIEIIPCDLSDKLSVDNLSTKSLSIAKQLHATKAIDILINNGGISSRSSFIDTDISVDEKLMQVNFFSGAQLAKSIIPSMVDQSSGRIIWISSIQGKLGTPFRTSYAASKFAVQGYCEALRSELTSSNVHVHVVSPGYIRTNLSKSAVLGDGKSYGITDVTTANGKDPDEVATTIMNSVANEQMDFIVAATFSAKVALWLKFLAPSFLDNMLVKRFEKQKTEMKEKTS
jgi:dehydrogenase/reductase SDR family protein 7B